MSQSSLEKYQATKNEVNTLHWFTMIFMIDSVTRNSCLKHGRRGGWWCAYEYVQAEMFSMNQTLRESVFMGFFRTTTMIVLINWFFFIKARGAMNILVWAKINESSRIRFVGGCHRHEKGVKHNSSSIGLSNWLFGQRRLLSIYDKENWPMKCN